MDDAPDPISQFFPDVDPEDVDLYAVLNLTSSAKEDEIKRAYRKLALIYHPDKHTSSDEEAKTSALLKFQQVGFAYAVLGDERRRQRYVKTGRTDEGFNLDAEEGGWEAYLEDLFDRVTKDKLEELKKEYQGSQEETDDLMEAYHDCDGDINVIMTHIPHSTVDDEPRFIKLISSKLESGDLPAAKKWEKSVKDEKARLVRKKQADKEAKEAEELAKELGVWDEFFGSGKPSSSRKGKGKSKTKAEEEESEEEDTSALQALILKKRKNMDGFFDGLAAKYASAEPVKSKSGGKGKGKKRSKPTEADNHDEDEPAASPKKKSRKAVPEPDIDDDEFERLQQKLFGDKGKSGKPDSAKGKKAMVEEEAEPPKKRATRGRKAKGA